VGLSCPLQRSRWPATVLPHNGRNDILRTRAELDRWHDTASQPKLVLWYDASHELNLVAADDLDAVLSALLDV
jgi:hypothetical protein